MTTAKKTHHPHEKSHHASHEEEEPGLGATESPEDEKSLVREFRLNSTDTVQLTPDEYRRLKLTS